MTSIPSEKRTVKIGEAAKLLGISIDTLRRWEKQGKITSSRTLGGTRVYSVKLLNEFLPKDEEASVKATPVDSSFQQTQSLLDSVYQDQSPVAVKLPQNTWFEEKKADLAGIKGDLSSEIKHLVISDQPVSIKKKSAKPVLKFGFYIFALCFILSFLTTAALTGLHLINPDLLEDFYQQNQKSPYLVSVNNILLPFDNISKEIVTLVAPYEEKSLASLENPNVLAASSIAKEGKFLEVNADVNFTGNIAVEGEGIFTENLTAPNIVYLVNAGENITITGDPQRPTISSTGSNDTLATVTARGATTTTAVTLSGGATLGATLNLGQLSSDPTSAVNGATYYNTTSNIFRCYKNGSWVNCDTNTGGDGDITAVSPGDGLGGGGSSGSVTLSVDATTTSTTTTTSSNSGLEATSTGLRLLGGCSNSNTLTWDSTDAVWECAAGGGTFTLAGDSGTSQTISGSDTLTISGGTNGIDTVTSATDTITLNLDTTEIGTSTFGSGSGFAWTFDAGSIDPILAFTSGQISIGSAVQSTITAFTVIDNPAITATSNQNFFKTLIDNNAAVTITSATTSSIVASLAIDEPNITATGTVTNATTLYISDAPTEGSSGNFALWVDNGESRFENTPVSGSTSGSALTVVPSYVVEAADITLSGLRVALDTNSNADSGDTAYGVNIDDITSAAGPTEYGLRVGSGYDYQAYFELGTRDLRLSVTAPSAGTSPLTLTVPAVAADDTVCLATLANCTGAGGGSGVTYTSQTTNALTRFTSTSGQITSAGLLDDGSTFTFSANRAISMAAGTGSFTQTYQPVGSTGTANAHSITSTFGIDATDQTLSGLFIDADTASNGDSGDTLYGIQIDAITASSASEYGLAIGSGFDSNLYLNDTTSRVLLADGGTIVIHDGTNTLCTVTDSGTTGDLSCTGNITGGSSGTSGFWSRSSTTLSPATANDVVSITSNDNTNATLAIINNTANTIGASAAIGIVDYASTSLTTGTLLNLELTEGTLNGGYYLKAWDATAGSAVFTVAEDGVTTIAGSAEGTASLTQTAGDHVITDGDLTLSGGEFSMTTDDTGSTAATFDLDTITTATAFDLSLDGLTTGTGLLIDDNTAAGLSTGTLLHINSVSTALAGTATTGDGLLANFDWNPGSASTTGTGDLFRIRIDDNGTLTSGSLFNIVDESTSIFSISETAVTTSLPTNFTSAGDVSMAYDLNFTNPTASFITSSAPLTLRAGESFNSSNLTLAVYNAGSVVVDGSTDVNTGTTGVLDLNVNSSTTSNIGFNIDYTSDSGVTAAADLFAGVINLQQNDADGDLFGLLINHNSNSTTLSGTNYVECMLCIENDENTAAAVADAIRISSTAATAGSITTAIDIDTTDVTTDIELQNGETIDNNADGTIALVATTLSATSTTAFNCSDCIDFDDLEDTLDLDANLTLNQTTSTWSQTFTGDTTTGLTYTANSLTSGTGVLLTSTGTITSGGEVLNVTGNSATTGRLIDLSATGLTTGTGITLTLGTALTTGGGLNITGASYNHTGSETGYVSQISFTDASSQASGNGVTYGLQVIPTVNSTGSGGTNSIIGISSAPTFTACSSGASCLIYSYIAVQPTISHSGSNTITVNNFASLSNGALTNSSTGTINWRGGNITTPAITQTSGTISSIAYLATLGSVTTAGTQTGLEIVLPATTNAGSTYYGINIDGITTGNGTDTAINIGTGWDRELDVATALEIGINSQTEIILDPSNFGPGSDGGNSLGSGSVSWLSLFLDTTSVINFDNGDVTITHSTDTLTFASGDINIGITDADTVNIDGDGSPSADILQIGSGDVSATAGVDALQITFDSANASGNAIDITLSAITGNGSDTTIAIDIDDFSYTSSAGTDVVTGLNVGVLTESGTITSTGIAIGSGWDNALNVNAGKATIASTGITAVNFNGTATTNGVCHSSTDIDAATDATRDLVACSAAEADIAEWYETYSGVEPGDIVMSTPETLTYQSKKVDALTGIITEELATHTVAKLNKTDGQYQNNIIGIVSTSPNQTIGKAIIGYANNPQPVALNGRVPVKVSSENGPVQAGDYLTSSSVPGVAMKATKPGQVVGKALADFIPNCNPNPGSYCQGKVMVFINVTHADPNNALANMIFDDQGKLIVSANSINLSEVSAYIDNNILGANTTSLTTTVSQIQSDLATNSQDNIETASKLQTIDAELAAQKTTTAELALKQQELEGKISSLEERVIASEAKQSQTNQEIATDSSSPRNDDIELNLTPPDILLATGSATLTDLTVTNNLSSDTLLEALDVTVSGIFKALGEVNLGSTTISGDLTVDGTFSISQNSLNSLTTLYIQNSPLAEKVDFFNGLVTINKDGAVLANSITAEEYRVISGKSSGTGTLATGLYEVPIFVDRVSDSSRIFITPTSPTAQTLSVTAKVTGSGFVVSSTLPATQDITFDWWIINEIASTE